MLAIGDLLRPSLLGVLAGTKDAAVTRREHPPERGQKTTSGLSKKMIVVMTPLLIATLGGSVFKREKGAPVGVTPPTPPLPPQAS